VTREYIYSSLKQAPPPLDFSDQYAFQPTGSTTAALISLLHTITSMLETNQFVIVYAIDFSKAFDSVRHSTLMEKFALLSLPDNVYNWIRSFFNAHSHVTTFRGETSSVESILASIIQGSAIGPASYVVTASDLHAVDPVNKIKKYADDTYLLIPASKAHTCTIEIQHIEDWAVMNNLTLNRKKSIEVVFTAPRSRRKIVLPPPAVPGFERVESTKVLGVTFNNKLSFSDHVEDLLTKCSRTMFALRTLRSHGMPDSALHNVFQATVLAKLSYASSAWWGYTNACDRNRIEAFLKRSARSRFTASTTTFADLCQTADTRLFNNVTNNTGHLLYSLLPSERCDRYSLRARSHNFKLPVKTTRSENNFITRMLYRDNYYH
jgi:hypothetical protein